MLNPWTGIVLVLVILAGMTIALRWYQLACGPHPEVPRKLLHIGMGLITLMFPWWFDGAQPVILLAAISILWLYAVKTIRLLRRHLAGVIESVPRRTWGEFYFPVSVALMFVLSGDDPLRYGIPVLILLCADSAAALIGLRYGRHRYPVWGEEKSVEGSLAFFVTALLCTYVTLLLFTQVTQVQRVLISLVLAVHLTVIEAVSSNGLDNLFVPLAGFVLLSACLDREPLGLAVLLATGAVAAIFLIHPTQRPITWKQLGQEVAGNLAIARTAAHAVVTLNASLRHNKWTRSSA